MKTAEPAAGDLTHCRFCGRVILWALTTTGAKMPLDPQPKPWEPPPTVAGNIILENGVARTLKALELAMAPESPRYVSHFATCKEAQKDKAFQAQRREAAAKRAADRAFAGGQSRRDPCDP